MAVTWRDIDAIIGKYDGKPGFRSGNYRGWRIPSPTGGTLLVEVTLNPRWCTIAIDRWRTTDRDESRSEPWLKEHVWPHVDRALKVKRTGWGTLPCGHTFASAGPLERVVVPSLLAAWIGRELTWGIRADQQWPESAPHKVIPGPEGNYG